MRTAAIAFLVLGLAVAAGYGPAVGNGLVWDDRIHILDDPSVREARWWEIATRPIGSYYRPVVFATFAAEARLAAASPAVLHTTNLVLHALAASLLWSAIVTLGAGRGVALLGALLFALHPVQSEAVLYVSGRTDVLAAVFALLALLLHARGAGWNGRTARPSLRLAAAACFALALGCKESVAALPLALVLGDRMFRAGAEGSARRDLAALLPYAVVLAGHAALRAALPGEGLVLGSSGASHLAAAVAALADYARLLVAPVGLHLERFASAVPAWRVVAGVVALVGLGLWARWGPTPVRFWLLWAALAYLPTANLVPVYPGLPDGVVFAPEHFLYLPSTGILVALCLSWREASRRWRRIGVVALGFFLLVSVGVLHDRARDWRDEETLYRHTLAHAPESARVRLNLGNLHLARGETELAAREFASGLLHHPDDPDLSTNAGIAWMSLGRFAEAERALRRAVSLEPDDAQTWANLGALLGTTGRFEAARSAYENALARDPANADARAGRRRLDELTRPSGPRAE